MRNRRSVSVHGVVTSVIDEGTGPSVLLLHGNPDNADEWSSVIDRLKSDHRCIAPDLPGYGALGRTSALPDTFTYGVSEQIAFVDELLRALDVRDVVLVVHDIGGIMGVPWAARNAERLRGVVYTNTVAFPGFAWFPLARLWGSDRWLDRLRARLMMRAIGARGGAAFRRAFGAQNPQLSSEQLARFARDFALNAPAKATTLRQFAAITRPEYFDGYDDMLEAISAATRTHVLWGDGDPYVPDARADDLFAHEVEHLDGIGHWVPLLAADRVANAVRTVTDLREPNPGEPASRAV